MIAMARHLKPLKVETMKIGVSHPLTKVDLFLNRNDLTFYATIDAEVFSADNVEALREKVRRKGESYEALEWEGFIEINVYAGVGDGQLDGGCSITAIRYETAAVIRDKHLTRVRRAHVLDDADPKRKVRKHFHNTTGWRQVELPYTDARWEAVRTLSEDLKRCHARLSEIIAGGDRGLLGAYRINIDYRPTS